MKYHLNPFSGEPGKCRAVKGKCPWGTDDEHFSTEGEARVAYEEKMKEFVLTQTEEALFDLKLDEARANATIRKFDTFELESIVTFLTRQGEDSATAMLIAEIIEEEAQWETREALTALQPIHSSEGELLAERGALLENPLFPPARYHEINVDGVKCCHCSAQVSLRESFKLQSNENVICSSCGKDYDLDSVTIEVGPTKDTYRAYVKEEVVKMPWYHSSTTDNWDEALTKQGGFYSHLGSFQAAVDRQIAETVGHGASGFWLYELAIDETAVVQDEILLDDNGDYSGSFHPDRRAMKSNITRYFNKWEDLASISLIADTNKLKVVNKRFVEASEARATPSLYNIPSSGIGL